MTILTEKIDRMLILFQQEVDIYLKAENDLTQGRVEGMSVLLNSLHEEMTDDQFDTYCAHNSRLPDNWGTSRCC